MISEERLQYWMGLVEKHGAKKVVLHLLDLVDELTEKTKAPHADRPGPGATVGPLTGAKPTA